MIETLKQYYAEYLKSAVYKLSYPPAEEFKQYDKIQVEKFDKFVFYNMGDF